MIGHAVHGKYLHDIGQCSHLRLVLLQSLIVHLGPCRHDLYHTHLEHGIAPFVALREIVSSVVAATSPTGRVTDVARIAVGTDTDLMLVGTRRCELIVLIATDLHHRGTVDHLREE